jgi:hypothetical protein
MLLKESTNKSEVLQSLGRACRRGDHSVALLIAFEGTPIGKLGRGRYCFKNGSYDEAADGFIDKNFKKHLGRQVSIEASPARVPISAPVTEVVPLVSASALGGSSGDSSGGSSGLGASGVPDKKRGRAEETGRQPRKLVRQEETSSQELLEILKEKIQLLKDFYVGIHAEALRRSCSEPIDLEDLRLGVCKAISGLNFENLMKKIDGKYTVHLKKLSGDERYFSTSLSKFVISKAVYTKSVIQLFETQDRSFTFGFLDLSSLKRPAAAIAVETAEEGEGAGASAADQSKRLRVKEVEVEVEVEKKLGVPKVIIPVQESFGGGGSSGSGSGSSSDGPASATAASATTSGSGMALAFGAAALFSPASSSAISCRPLQFFPPEKPAVPTPIQEAEDFFNHLKILSPLELAKRLIEMASFLDNWERDPARRPGVNLGFSVTRQLYWLSDYALKSLRSLAQDESIASEIKELNACGEVFLSQANKKFEGQAIKPIGELRALVSFLSEEIEKNKARGLPRLGALWQGSASMAERGVCLES